MSTLTITAASNVLLSARRQGLAAVRLGKKRARRALASAAASLAAVVIAVTLAYGYQSSRPPPDLVTFAFRV